ncbi:hypothetical protein R1sor_011589 [Riccia sorocarpa]|uniref:Uncharacterized protein n=1 Tax=Riccia sorocarpa TaxID=122646 RepID=A0ABD3I1B2_9MARC
MAVQGVCGLGAARALSLTSLTASPQGKLRLALGLGVNAAFSGKTRIAIQNNGALRRSHSKIYKAGERRILDGQLLGSWRTMVRAQMSSGSESGFVPEEEKSSPVDPETGIDADGYVTVGLPKEFSELMKEEPEPPNYGLLGLGFAVAVLARHIIWREILNWINLAFFLVVFATESAQALAYKAVEYGGQPVESVVNVFWIAAQVVIHFFRVAGDVVSVGPVAFAILLSTAVLLVGQNVSRTYEEAPEFPSRNMFDFAGILGLAGVVEFISPEFMLLALIGLSGYLLGVKKLNPVAGFAPAVATLVAIAGPALRWPLLAAFLGYSVFRYWRKGYISQGAVFTTEIGWYPRVLVGLVYLLGISILSKFVFAFEALLSASPPPLEE